MHKYKLLYLYVFSYIQSRHRAAKAADSVQKQQSEWSTSVAFN